MKKMVAVTQPYVPNYRFALWDGVASRMESEGVAFRVFFGGNRAQMADREARGDAVEAEWAEQVPTWTFSMSSRLPRAVYRQIPKQWDQGVLLTEMQVTNANAWERVALRRPFITIGHGRSYTGTEGRLSAGLETVQNRAARHALTYMESGRSEVQRRTGLPANRVTAFGNSTDSRRLKSALAECSAAAVQQFRAQHGIPPTARVALYVGALNEHKRIDLLAEAAEKVFESDPDWWLVVAGAGPASSRLESIERNSRVIQLGYVSVMDLAPAALNAQVLVNPGRVGLVAVDSLTMQLPVLTTRFPFHAPEIEYLREGESLFVSDPTPVDFANMWMTFQPSASSQFTAPTIEDSISRISEVLLANV